MARRLKQPKESKIRELKTSSLLVNKNMRSVLGVDIALVVIIMIEPIANDIVYYFRCISTINSKKKTIRALSKMQGSDDIRGKT